MATKNEAPPPAPVDDAPPPPKKKIGKLIVVGSVVVGLLIAIGVTAFLLLSKGHDADDPDAATTAEKPAGKSGDKKQERRPSYLALEPFTVNLVAESGDQYLQIALSLDMVDADAAEKAKIYMAKIRNDIMLMLSAKKASELISREGKQTLALELRSQVNGILDPEGRAKKSTNPPVKEVLFTSFIIQ